MPSRNSNLSAIQRQIATLTERLRAASPNPTTPPKSLAQFLRRCVQIRTESGRWIPFELWDEQARGVGYLERHRLNVWLKARQLGCTWIALAFALHRVLTQPGTTVLLFSRRDTEAVEMLSRVKAMARRLPESMQPSVLVDNDHTWQLGNEARILCFPTTAGDSYTASLVVVDEADLIPNLDRLMAAVKPTIDAGGQMLLLSRVDKHKPNSVFKSTYLSARDGASPWHPFFMPWHARPDRDREWYEEQKRDIFARTGSLDDLWEQYPETDDEALAPCQLDKRISALWISAVSSLRPATTVRDNLRIWEPPTGERRYVIGADPAEGNPQSDDSAATVLDLDLGTQVAVLQGKIEPTVFAHRLSDIATQYHNAAILCERNNHGHAVIAALESLGARVLKGHDGRVGWLSSGKGKVLLYNECADAVRDKQVTIRCIQTASQLKSIEGGTLRAPDGDHDDLADAFALACVAMGDAAAHRRVLRIGGR